jgi:thioredoxin reductase
MEQPTDSLKDLSIIGGGPAGIFAAFQCGMNDLSCYLLDSMGTLGGQLTALYPEKFIYDVAGFSKVTAAQLITQLWEQAKQFNPDVHCNEQVTDLQKLEDGTFCIATPSGKYFSRAVIICAGLGAFTPRKLELDGLSALEDASVFYAVKNKEDFRCKNVVIVGGGDSALDWAVTLLDMASRVTIVHRMVSFNGHGKTVAEVEAAQAAGRLDIWMKSEITAFDAVGGQLHSLTVSTPKQSATIKADVLLPLIGFRSDLGPAKNWGLDITDNHVVVNANMKTSIDGVYAAGDIAEYAGKLRLIQTALGDATMAVRHSLSYIKPNQKNKTQFSSTKFAVKEINADKKV